MSFRRGYYEILQVSQNADLEVIKAAHKQLVKKHHPDQGGDHEKMKVINEAYEVLSNAELRLKYDQWLEQIEQQEKFSNNNNRGKGNPKNPNQSNYKSADREDVFSDKEKNKNTRSDSASKTPIITFPNRGLWISIALIITSIIMMPLFPEHEGISVLIGWIGIIWLYVSTGSFILTILGVVVLVSIIEIITRLLF